jgi:hypothetical protein
MKQSVAYKLGFSVGMECAFYEVFNPLFQAILGPTNHYDFDCSDDARTLTITNWNTDTQRDIHFDEYQYVWDLTPSDSLLKNDHTKGKEQGYKLFLKIWQGRVNAIRQMLESIKLEDQ